MHVQVPFLTHGRMKAMFKICRFVDKNGKCSELWLLNFGGCRLNLDDRKVQTISSCYQLTS